MSNMADYNSILDDIEPKQEERQGKTYFWQSSRQHEECCDLTVARDLSISIMTIFEIDSIEMKEGFIY